MWGCEGSLVGKFLLRLPFMAGCVMEELRTDPVPERAIEARVQGDHLKCGLSLTAAPANRCGIAAQIVVIGRL